jgi:hypothetical protein
MSPDGRRVVTGGMHSALVWDLPARVIGVPEEAADLPRLWADLAGEDAARAYRAVWRLRLMPGGRVEAYLADRLRPAAAPDAAALGQLLRDLDDRGFDRRERAEAELAKLGAAAEPALRQALRRDPGLEPRRRLERLIRSVPPPDAAERQAIRAVEVLEARGSAAARRLLETLARGADGARITVEARDALARLGS